MIVASQQWHSRMDKLIFEQTIISKKSPFGGQSKSDGGSYNQVKTPGPYKRVNTIMTGGTPGYKIVNILAYRGC